MLSKSSGFRLAVMLLQESIKKIAKVGFGLAETGLSSTIGRANKVLLHGESVSLPPGLAGLPKNISDLPANILSALPDIIARYPTLAVVSMCFPHWSLL